MDTKGNPDTVPGAPLGRTREASGAAVGRRKRGRKAVPVFKSPAKTFLCPRKTNIVGGTVGAVLLGVRLLRLVGGTVAGRYVTGPRRGLRRRSKGRETKMQRKAKAAGGKSA